MWYYTSRPIKDAATVGGIKTDRQVGVNDGEGPPVPIPNTEVKLTRAEDTWLETARENRSMPTLKATVQ